MAHLLVTAWEGEKGLAQHPVVPSSELQGARLQLSLNFLCVHDYTHTDKEKLCNLFNLNCRSPQEA